MEDTALQLARLRRRIARIDRKYTRRYDRPQASAIRVVPRHAGHFIEELVTGEVVRTAFGEHFETERLWEPHRRHGSIGVGDLGDLPEDLLSALSAGVISPSRPSSWAFLDTETTGFEGAYAFLIGVGSIDPAGFRLRQFFLRDAGEEASALARLAEYPASFQVLITYNGKTYDQPLLENRFRVARASPRPLTRLPHLDLLAGARRLWKLRLESCRLVDLEYRILGVERDGDLPGALIPYYYYDYLRTQQAMRLVPILHHNAMDILSLACLTAVVSTAFRSPSEAAFRHGADLIGLGRWLMASKQLDAAQRAFRRAVELGLPDHLLFRTLWEIAAIEKRLGRAEAALAAWEDLTGSPNPYRARAFDALAKHYERRRDFSAALRMARSALASGASEQQAAHWARREQRLAARIAKTAKRKRFDQASADETNAR
jgi:uncharacterized protein